jgi:hypothetical protein
LKHNNERPSIDSSNVANSEKSGKNSMLKAVGFGALIGLSVGVGHSVYSHDIFGENDVELTEAERANAAAATNEIANRYISCELVGIKDTHKLLGSQMKPSNDYPRNGVIATFAVKRNEQAAAYATKYAHDSAVIWHDPSVHA